MSDNNPAQPAYALPQPPADMQNLNRLVGTWAVSDPSGEAAISGTVRYEWMEGGFFLLQYVDLNHGGNIIKGLEVIGHEQLFGAAEPSQDIKSRFYDNQGNTFDYVYELEGDTLTIWGGQKGSPAYYQGKFNEDGTTNSGGWVYPGGGGYASSMTRVGE